MSESPLRCQIPWERYGLIAAIVRELYPRSPQLGKTVLQKVVYLLQDLAGVPIGYRFQFYTYGPFSVELLEDLDLVEGLGGVKIHRVVSLTGGFDIVPGGRADDLIRKAGNWLEGRGANDAISRVVEDYGHLSARDLELRATVVYVVRDLELRGTVGDNDRVKEVVKDLKPRFGAPEIEDAVQELHRNWMSADGRVGDASKSDQGL